MANRLPGMVRKEQAIYPLILDNHFTSPPVVEKVGMGNTAGHGFCLSQGEGLSISGVHREIHRLA